PPAASRLPLQQRCRRRSSVARRAGNAVRSRHPECRTRRSCRRRSARTGSPARTAAPGASQACVRHARTASTRAAARPGRRPRPEQVVSAMFGRAGAWKWWPELPRRGHDTVLGAESKREVRDMRRVEAEDSTTSCCKLILKAEEIEELKLAGSITVSRGAAG